MLNNYFFYKISRQLTFGKLSHGGRNFLGRICVFHRGGENKRNYRLVDYYRRVNSFGIVLHVFKDSLRTAFMGLVLYANGLSSYMILSDGVTRGVIFYSGYILPKFNKSQLDCLFDSGTSLPLRYLNLFTKINNIEKFPLSGAIFCRAAGVGGLFSAKLDKKCIVKLSSGWQIFVSIDSMASIGIVSNPLHKHDKIMKAGSNR
jgi:large subunit ribosomal protein L2